MGGNESKSISFPMYCHTVGSWFIYISEGESPWQAPPDDVEVFIYYTFFWQSLHARRQYFTVVWRLVWWFWLVSDSCKLILYSLVRRVTYDAGGYVREKRTLCTWCNFQTNWQITSVGVIIVRGGRSDQYLTDCIGRWNNCQIFCELNYRKYGQQKDSKMDSKSAPILGYIPRHSVLDVDYQRNVF